MALNPVFTVAAARNCGEHHGDRNQLDGPAEPSPLLCPMAEIESRVSLILCNMYIYEGNRGQKMVAAATSVSRSRKEYLKRYEDKSKEEKKKKKKMKVKPSTTGVVVVDQDPVWQKQVTLQEDENADSADEEKPLVDEDIEVKCLRRHEQLRLRHPFGAISGDGSGWISIFDASKPLNSKDQNSDISPLPKCSKRNDTSSSEHELKPSGSCREVIDSSPPRQLRTCYLIPSPEPETKVLRSCGPDTKHLNCNVQNSDISPRKRRARHDTTSPDPNLKPSESGREVTDFLTSPKRQRPLHTPSPEPETRQLLSSGSDPYFSPPRQPCPQKSAQYEGKNSEISGIPDISPPQRGCSGSLYQDISHPGADLSPPRKGGMGLSLLRNIRKKSFSLKEWTKTGLISGQDIKEENTRTKKDDWERFKDLDPSICGRGAQPVYRDKATGARISRNELMKSTKKDGKPKEIKLEWGHGLAQKREAETRQLELELEKEKPFAQTRDDLELNRMLKDRARWGDPMASFVKSKHSVPVLPDLGDDENMKISGFIIPQKIPSHSWILRGLDVAPNRYGIKPGRHWDGVNRSNGKSC